MDCNATNVFDYIYIYFFFSFRWILLREGLFTEKFVIVPINTSEN